MGPDRPPARSRTGFGKVKSEFIRFSRCCRNLSGSLCLNLSGLDLSGLDLSGLTCWVYPVWIYPVILGSFVLCCWWFVVCCWLCVCFFIGLVENIFFIGLVEHTTTTPTTT